MQEHIRLTELSDADLSTFNKEELTDMSGFTFDTSIPHEQRAAVMLGKLRNPNCFRIEDMGVKLEYPENAPSLTDCLTEFLKRKKGGL